MNNQLISKIIKFNNKSTPNIIYDNPLLDSNVARELSKSFVRILSISNQNSTTNNNLRFSILENIRKLCRIEPEDHVKIDDNFTEIINDLYNMHLSHVSKNSIEDSTERKLDSFLVKKMKGLEIKSNFEPSLNPEVIQALINLNNKGIYLNKLSSDIVRWDVKDIRYRNILKGLWSLESIDQDFETLDNMAVKMKADNEKLLLETALYILTHSEESTEDIITKNEDIQSLFKIAAKSHECFHTCCGVLNFLFIMTDFDVAIKKFVSIFVDSVKIITSDQTIAVLYSSHLQGLSLLMDVDDEILNDPNAKNLIEKCLKLLHDLHSESEYDFILMLSHYPQWFDLYFHRYGC